MATTSSGERENGTCLFVSERSTSPLSLKSVNYAPPKGGELVMLPMLPWQAYSTIGWLTCTLPLRFIGIPLNEKGCLITFQQSTLLVVLSVQLA